MQFASKFILAFIFATIGAMALPTGPSGKHSLRFGSSFDLANFNLQPNLLRFVSIPRRNYFICLRSDAGFGAGRLVILAARLPAIEWYFRKHSVASDLQVHVGSSRLRRLYLPVHYFQKPA